MNVSSLDCQSRADVNKQLTQNTPAKSNPQRTFLKCKLK